MALGSLVLSSGQWKATTGFYEEEEYKVCVLERSFWQPHGDWEYTEDQEAMRRDSE